MATQPQLDATMFKALIFKINCGTTQMLLLKVRHLTKELLYDIPKELLYDIPKELLLKPKKLLYDMFQQKKVVKQSMRENPYLDIE